jgi:hypothetical protein
VTRDTSTRYVGMDDDGRRSFGGLHSDVSRLTVHPLLLTQIKMVHPDWFMGEFASGICRSARSALLGLTSCPSSADVPLSWEVTSCERTFFEIGLDISEGRDDTTEAEAIAISKGHTGNPEEEKGLVRSRPHRSGPHHRED